MEKRNDSRTLKWIYAQTAGHRAELLLLMLCNALSSAAAVLFAVLSKSFLDKALRRENAALYGALMAAALLTQIIFRITAGMLSAKISGKINISIKSGIFEKLLKKSYKEVSAYHSGELLNRMFSDTEVVCSGITEIIPNAVSVVTRLLAVFAALYLFDPRLVAAALLIGVVVFCATRVLRRTMKSRHLKVQQASDKVRSFFQESTDRLLIIKIFGGAEKTLSKALSLQKEHFKASVSRAFLSLATGSGFFFVFRAGYLAVLIYCAASLSRGEAFMTVGTMTALLQLVAQIQQPFASLSGIMPKYYASCASAERILELLDIKEESLPYSFEEAGKIFDRADGITVDGVSLDYGRGTVLKNASAFIPKNKLTLISGTTGTGKTSLFMLLLGIYSHEGSIRAADTILDEKTRSLFAYVPQGNLLFSGTVRENLNLTREYSEEELNKALKTACAYDFVSRMPKGLETEIGEHGCAVSEGQAQRLAVARALLSDAPVLLLDESTSALDAETESRLLSNIASINKTVLLISHKEAALAVCDLELRIENGKITEIKKEK